MTCRRRRSGFLCFGMRRYLTMVWQRRPQLIPDGSDGRVQSPATCAASSRTRCWCIFFCEMEKNHHAPSQADFGGETLAGGKRSRNGDFLWSPTMPPPARLLSQGMASDLLLACSSMTKSFDTISEAVRNTKHAFAKADNYTKKPLRNRYERRKVRSYLTLTDWLLGESN